MPVRRSQARAAPAVRTNLHELKTKLQQRRDQYGFRIAKKHNTKWIPNPLKPNQAKRADKEPRGIENPAGSNRCYQNVVHQALLHTPVWCKWILEHDSTDPAHASANCVRCSYKSLMTDYWGASDPNTVFQADSPYLTQIANAAAADPSGQFAHGVAGDAADFYNWVTNQMEEPAVFGNPDPDPIWNEELDALYQIDYRTEFECERCQTSVTVNGATPSARSISLIFDPARHPDLGYMLHDHLRGRDQLNCATCNNVEWHRRDRKIEAAPQVLRIFVQIFRNAGATPVKLCHRFEIPSALQLSRLQTNTELPLEYSLSSAIAHGGGQQRELWGLGAAAVAASTPSRYDVTRRFTRLADRLRPQNSNAGVREDPLPLNSGNVDNGSSHVTQIALSPSTARTEGNYMTRSKTNETAQRIQKPSVGRFVSMIPNRAKTSSWRPGCDRNWNQTPAISSVELSACESQAHALCRRPFSDNGSAEEDSEAEKYQDADEDLIVELQYIENDGREPSEYPDGFEMRTPPLDPRLFDEVESNHALSAYSSPSPIAPSPPHASYDLDNDEAELAELKELAHQAALRAMEEAHLADVAALRARHEHENATRAAKSSVLRNSIRDIKAGRIDANSPMPDFLSDTSSIALSSEAEISELSNYESTYCSSDGPNDPLSDDTESNDRSSDGRNDMLSDETVDGNDNESNNGSNDEAEDVNEEVQDDAANSHYIINVRGKLPRDCFHISDDHYNGESALRLWDNPQRPTDECARTDGYQVYVLTYTRNRLTGRYKKLEDNIPPFI